MKPRRLMTDDSSIPHPIHFFNWSKRVKFMNMYGPTEASIGYIHTHVTNVSLTGLIGRPLPNNRLYILDESLRPALIGGIQLARGYLDQPKQTKKSFILNPFVSWMRKQWTLTMQVQMMTKANQRSPRNCRIDPISMDTEVDNAEHPALTMPPEGPRVMKVMGVMKVREGTQIGVMEMKKTKKTKRTHPDQARIHLASVTQTMLSLKMTFGMNHTGLVIFR